MNRRTLTGAAGAVLLLALCAGTRAFAAETAIRSQHHPWGTADDFKTPITQSMVSDLTGMAVDGSVHAQRPLALVSRADEAHQPLYGIGSADIVYEFAAAGDLSETAALIQDWTKLPVIGMTSELKYYMVPVLGEWDAFLLHSAGDPYADSAISLMALPELSEVQDAALAQRDPDQRGFLYRDERGDAVTRAADLVRACGSLGYDTGVDRQSTGNHFSFSAWEETLEEYGGAQGDLYTADYVDLSRMFRDSRSAFVYDGENKVYRKFGHDAPQYDALTGEQLTFSNLIIQCVPYCTLEDGNVGAGILQESGSQYGYFITRGRAIPITWQKLTNEERTVFYDRNGQEIRLNPGRTYLALAQADLPILLK